MREDHTRRRRWKIASDSSPVAGKSKLRQKFPKVATVSSSGKTWRDQWHSILDSQAFMQASAWAKLGDSVSAMELSRFSYFSLFFRIPSCENLRYLGVFIQIPDIVAKY
ncbi:hypothetical protein PanWU01x14_354190 [Parasponia andersonii]|uniref:Uncharacterized protein n=1 Tax=Parasponia andersonii TaxID=3476 RepID=A0A2P5A9R0_PARAD|nr:hypothetical protein PanWU01x14_354190 [Parasponia andersonii]